MNDENTIQLAINTIRTLSIDAVQQASPKPSPAEERQPWETQIPIRAPDYSNFAGYPHWGLNE